MDGVKAVPRSEWCQSLAVRNLGWVLSSRYVQNVDQAARRKQIAQEVTNAVVQEFTTVVSGTTWMDAAARTTAVAKLASTTFKIGYPDISLPFLDK